ncbi:hypothetical protein [Roseibium sp.]|uniref:hypothetical protein n=1 Tax=Roseibium sp. TaxID=1936156 RepID=UPI003BA9BF7D
MRDTLEKLVCSWDGKTTSTLKTAYERFHLQPGFVDHLIDLSTDQSCDRGATWLLKHAFSKGEPALSEKRSARHLAALAHFSHWETRLHLLQYFDHLTIPGEAERPLHVFILQSLEAENRFLRAWAYYALALHAERFPLHRNEALDRLKEAMTRETAGSVRVRVLKALERINP